MPLEDLIDDSLEEKRWAETQFRQQGCSNLLWDHFSWDDGSNWDDRYDYRWEETEFNIAKRINGELNG